MANYRRVGVSVGVFLASIIGIIANPIVTVNQGALEGKTLTTGNGFAYNAFLGIPYAKPPVGSLRFQDPQPADRWVGTRDATVLGSVCAAYGIFFSSGYEGSEDCLYLNVYVPETATPNSTLPIMFWIYGGSFTGGNGNPDFYGPDYLVEKNVIVVTFNYRLGALGFLCLHNARTPGNAGLKDQIMALQWVNDNIHNFGGNKQNITIFGESAGGASVHLLMMSPLATGLYTQAISQSGVSVNEWVIQSDPVSKAFRLGQLLGYQTTNKDLLLQYLLVIPVQLLVTASLGVTSDNNELPLAPVIEQPFDSVISFLSEDPRDLILAGRFNKVPTISGFNSQEGVLFIVTLLAYGVDLNTVTLNDLIPNFNAYIPSHLAKHMNAATSTVVGNSIRQFYFDNNNGLLDNYISLITDYTYVKDANFAIKLFAQYAASYYYRFSYFGTLNYLYLLSQYPYTGAGHSDELGYLFKSNLPIQASAADTKIINEMAELWTNFAKYGNPTPQLSENINTIWDPVTSDRLNCLDINTQTTLIQKPFEERVQFWENMEEMYG